MKRPFNPDKEVCDYCNHIMHAHIQVLRENKEVTRDRKHLVHGSWFKVISGARIMED